MMNEKDKYTVVLLDAEGCELASDQIMSLGAGAAQAKQWLTDAEYISAGAFKVEVRENNTARGVTACVKDYFLSRMPSKNTLPRGEHKGPRAPRLPKIPPL